MKLFIILKVPMKFVSICKNFRLSYETKESLAPTTPTLSVPKNYQLCFYIWRSAWDLIITGLISSESRRTRDNSLVRILATVVSIFCPRTPVLELISHSLPLVDFALTTAPQVGLYDRKRPLYPPTCFIAEGRCFIVNCKDRLEGSMMILFIWRYLVCTRHSA